MNDQIDPNHKVWPQSPWVPYDPRVLLYDVDHWAFGAAAQAWEYTGWRDETLSWKKTAYIHGHLNPSPTVRVTGPDAREFLQSVCVNSLQKLQPGASRHAIMTDDAGRVAAHGMLVHTEEGVFDTYWLSPYLDFRASQDHGYDVTLENLTGQVFLFQIGGPKSLEILEDAAEQDLHDIAFLRTRLTTIAGEEVRILRIGMAGTLAYEVHGPIQVAQKVYQAIFDAGQPHGMRKLGVLGYTSNHTENGFPQAFGHFALPWGDEDPATYAFMKAVGFDSVEGIEYVGSVGNDPLRHYFTPYDLGWGHMVNFNHDFPGKAALQAVAEADATRMVTLVWNDEDVRAAVTSIFDEDSANVTPMTLPGGIGTWQTGREKQTLRADKVLVDGVDIGTTSARTFTEWSHETLSLATIATEHAEIGTDVTVLWGDEGTRQIEIRAKVARFPYLIDPPRNEVFDVSTIPRKYAS